MKRNKLLRTLHVNRLVVVMISLIFLIITHPIFEQWPSGRICFHISFSIVTLASLFAVSRTRLTLSVAIVLGLPSVLLYWVSMLTSVQFLHEPHIVAARQFLIAAFLIVICGYMLQHVMLAGSITIEKLCGAISVYLMMGLIFGYLYTGVYAVDSGAFLFPEHLTVEHPDLQFDEYKITSYLLYFSFVTMVTLGYGEIVPISGWARMLSVIEGLAGQLYLTVMMARLVGLHIVSSTRFSNHNGED